MRKLFKGTGKNHRGLYVAYGSNMNVEQMKRRCPGAELIGPCYIVGYRLTFVDGVATIVNAPQETPGALWRIKPEDEERLDIYEGFPRAYRKQMVKVRHKGKIKEAMAYIANSARIYPPTYLYYATIMQGYLDLGFPEELLNEAVLEVLMEPDDKRKQRIKGRRK